MEQPKIPTKGGVIAYLNVEGAQKASEFYQKAFGATQAHIYPPDEQGRTMHVHLYIHDGSVMLSDPFPEHGCGYEPVKGVSLMFPVDDVDAWFDRAVKTGCTGNMPPADMFWGDRYAQVKDPFNVTWAMVGPKKG